MVDRAERALLTRTVRDALAGAGDGDAVLAKLGWLDLLAAEADVAVDVVFRALGETGATTSALDDVVVGALGKEPHPGRAALLPPFGAWDAPGRVEAGHLRAAGLATARSRTADDLLVVCETSIATVPARTARITAVRGIDPDARLQAIEVDTDDAPTTALDRARWDDAVALARRAVSYQMAGAARAMLDLARAHAVDRVQFGHPVAHFQAVRHRLAEALVAIEALDATLAAAADEPGPLTAALAKAVAGRTGRTVAAHCQQVLAGVGFTTEHPFHRYLKRTMLLDGLFGAADDIVVAIGRELVSKRTVPTLIEL